MGNENDGKYFQVTSDGNIYAPGFSVVGGNATFSGSLSGATGSFSGSLTANAINAVNTINIAGNAVSVSAGVYSPGLLYTSQTYDQTSQELTVTYSSPAKVTVLVSYYSNTDWALVDITLNGSLIRESNIGKAWSTTTISIVVDVPAGTVTFGTILRAIGNANGDYIEKRSLSAIGLMR